MSSFTGKVDDSEDAMLLIEACRLGRIPNAGRRLSKAECARVIKSGAVFVWREGSNIDEVCRWTDGRKWGKSRIDGVFLVYNERVPPRQARTCATLVHSNEEPLVKKAVTLKLKNGERFRLVAYYCESDIPNLVSPKSEENLQRISVQRDLYPEMNRAEQYDKNENDRKRKKSRASSSATGASRANSRDQETFGILFSSTILYFIFISSRCISVFWAQINRWTTWSAIVNVTTRIFN